MTQNAHKDRTRIEATWFSALSIFYHALGFIGVSDHLRLRVSNRNYPHARASGGIAEAIGI